MGLLSSLFGGTSNDAKRKSRLQENLAKQQQSLGDLYGERLKFASPYEQTTIQRMLQEAGLLPGSGYGVQSPQTGAGLGTRADLNGGHPFPLYGSRGTLPGVQVTQSAGTPVGPQDLGIYDSAEYRGLRQKAEQDISHFANRQRQDYSSTLHDRGIGDSSVAAGGQARITGDAEKQYADYIRQLSIQAADKQHQLEDRAFSALQPSLGAGATAAQIYGGAGQGYGQSAATRATQSPGLLTPLIGAAAQYFGYNAGMGGAGAAKPQIPYYTPGTGDYGTDFFVDPNGTPQSAVWY